MKNTGKFGFTLVEVLIVISIISILITIAITIYNDYSRNSAKKVLLHDTKNCLNVCVAKFSDNTQTECQAHDCPISQYTASCVPDLNSPVYVKCEGKGIIVGYSCSVYQSGEVVCS